jgi:transcriptional regulator with XRE-family HTH domain
MSGVAERSSCARVMRSRRSAERCAPVRTAGLAVLGALVRQLRTERQLSRRALAKRSMVARSTIQRLERGLLRPRPSLLTWVANGLDPDRQRELREAMISAAGGADALAEDGKWAHRRSQQAPKGGLAGEVPLPSDLARRIALHNKATALRQQADTILDRPGRAG